jgi:hypothetical protein
MGSPSGMQWNGFMSVRGMEQCFLELPLSSKYGAFATLALGGTCCGASWSIDVF